MLTNYLHILLLTQIKQLTFDFYHPIQEIYKINSSLVCFSSDLIFELSYTCLRYEITSINIVHDQIIHIKIEQFKTLQNELVKLPKVKTVVEVIKCEVKWIISEQ